MRRPLAVLALALMLLGSAVATGAVSLAVARLMTGLGAVLAGDEWLVSPPRHLSGVVIVLTGGGASDTGSSRGSSRPR